jgi:hypothetical protein
MPAGIGRDSLIEKIRESIWTPVHLVVRPVAVPKLTYPQIHETNRGLTRPLESLKMESPSGLQSSGNGNVILE